MMIAVIALLLISPFVVVLELCLVALLIVELVPLGVVHDFVQRINASISAILGDSFIFASSEIRQQAVISKLTADLAWLESKFGCRHIVLVGHSQGAAISYLTLKKCGLGKVRLLITFGSGLHKLCQLIEPERKWQIASFAVFPLFAGITSLIAVAAWFGIYPLTGIWSTPIVAPLLVVLVVYGGLVEPTEEIELQASEFARQGLKWVDLYASMDPVPNGPLFLSDTAYLESIEVCNQLSLTADHTSYAKNTDEFLPLIVNAIAQHSGTELQLKELNLLNESVQVYAKRLRRIRICSSKIDQGLLFAALVAFLLDREAINSVGMWLGGWINAACSQAGVESCWKFPAMATGLAVALVVYVFCRMCVQAIESYWSGTCNEAHRSADELDGVKFVMFGHMLAGMALSLVSLLYYPQTFSWMEALHRYEDPMPMPIRVFQGVVLGILLGGILSILDLARVLPLYSLLRRPQTKNHTRHHDS
jgi:hypothetical protein